MVNLVNMRKPLYIVWNDSQMIHVPILDDQHHAVVATINSLYFFINQGWGLSALAPTLKIIKSSVGFHMKTEEGILETLGVNHKLLTKHEELHQVFNAQADAATQQALDEQDPMVLLNFLKQWWANHLIKEHREYADYLKSLTTYDDDD